MKVKNDHRSKFSNLSNWNAKFFQIRSTIAGYVDYAWHFSQSETAKYFEWIIINNYLNSFRIIPSLQTSYKNMLNSVDVKFMHLRWCMSIGRFRRKRVVHFCKYSLNSRCCPSNCLLAVLVMFLANSLPISSLPKQLNLVPRFLQ